MSDSLRSPTSSKDIERRTSSPAKFSCRSTFPSHFPRSRASSKSRNGRMDDISTVAAAFAIELNDAGRVESMRLAYGGVAATPIRAIEAEAELADARWNRSAIDKAKRVIAATVKPISDHRGSAEYRLAMAQSLLDKFWYEYDEREESSA